MCRITLLLSICLAFTACGSSTKDDIPLVEFTDQVDLKGTLYGQELIINFPSQLELIDSNLYLIRPGGCAAKVVRTSDASEAAIFGPLGKGPDEFIGPYAIRDEANHSTFTIFDITLKRLQTYQPEQQGDTLVFKATNRSQIPDNRIAYGSPIRLANGYYVAQIIAGTDNGDGLILLDKNLNTVKTFCNPLQENTVSKSHFSGTFASSGDTLIYAPMNIDYLVAYKISNSGDIQTLWEEFISQPIYEITSASAVRWDSKRHRAGSYDLRMTDKYIITLYSGKIWDLELGLMPETLLVFDRQGKPVKKINLGQQHGRFALTPDGKTMYTISYPEMHLVRYDLNQILD